MEKGSRWEGMHQLWEEVEYKSTMYYLPQYTQRIRLIVHSLLLLVKPLHLKFNTGSCPHHLPSHNKK